ncbi:MAG: hypothetical protein JXQ66_06545 [Campylobacterales bacterium]|nr:hypothetical protein [Campylobacterales bacterium]
MLSIINSQESIDTLTSVKVEDGTWVLSLSEHNMSIADSNVTTSKIFEYGWSLAGTSSDLNSSDISCNGATLNSIWKYKNNSWMLRTDIPNSLNLKSFESIDANDGFWVQCN